MDIFTPEMNARLTTLNAQAYRYGMIADSYSGAKEDREAARASMEALLPEIKTLQTAKTMQDQLDAIKPYLDTYPALRPLMVKALQVGISEAASIFAEAFQDETPWIRICETQARMSRLAWTAYLEAGFSSDQAMTLVLRDVSMLTDAVSKTFGSLKR